MKNKRKHGIKWIDYIGYASILGLMLVVGYLVAPQIQFGLGNYAGQRGSSQVLRAAVIDQLSSIRPESVLIQSAYKMLTDRGISTDIYLPGDVSVAFYAGLAKQGYKLIVLRVHTGIGYGQVPIGLFTSEPYDPNRYVIAQELGLIGVAQAGQGASLVFAVTPKFIRETMQGNFRGAIIILGGCYGLRGGELAQAFVDKGAGVVVGWTGLVDLAHTDRTLGVFLEEFIQEGKSIRQAVDDTMRAVGADPTFRSILSYYPTDQGSVVLSIVTPLALGSTTKWIASNPKIR